MAGLARGSLLGLFESVALSVGFDDVDSVGEAVKESSGEPLGTEDLGPTLKGEIVLGIRLWNLLLILIRSIPQMDPQTLKYNKTWVST